MMEHLICIGLGAGCLLTGVLFKLIPENCWRKIHFFKEAEVPED